MTDWIKETKEVLNKHKERGLYMGFVLPTEKVETCGECRNSIMPDLETLGIQSGLGVITWYCKDECWLKHI